MRIPALPLLLAVAACGGAHHPTPPSPAPTPTPTPKPTPTPTPKPTPAPVTVVRDLFSEGRHMGSETVTTAADGTITDTLDVLENGRGPHADATYTLAPDGTFATFTSKGHHMMGTPQEETFARVGDHVTWKTDLDSGEKDVKGPAFYLTTSIDNNGYLVAAALKNGGSIAILPAGTATVDKGPSVTIDGPDGKRTVVEYSIAGLDYQPVAVWMNEDGSYFGTVSEGFSDVPTGYEKSVDPLVAAQKQTRIDREVALAKAQTHTPPAAGLAYTHARVLDVDHGKWLADQTVLVVGGKIAKVGASKKVKVPDGAEVVDLAGKALIPGLVDMHAHLGDSDGVLDIASGVTTVRDVGNDPDYLDAQKAHFDDGSAIGPHIFRFGFIEGRGPKAASSKITAETEDEALAGVKFYVDRGWDGIKIYNSVKPELVPIITKAAHKAGRKVTGHIPVHMLAEEAVRAGYDGIEHINMLLLNFLATHDTDTRDTTRFTLVGDKGADLDLKSKKVKAFIKLLHDHKTVIDPTLGAFEWLLDSRPGVITPDLADVVAREPALLQRGYLENGLAGEDYDRYARSYQKCLDMVRALYDAKITLVLGTDQTGGLSLHHEMKLFARATIPNAAILKMATIGAARALGHDKEFGSIAAGKTADLVVIDGDPMKTITDIDRVVSTMRAGVVYASAPLYQAYGVAPAAP